MRLGQQEGLFSLTGFRLWLDTNFISANIYWASPTCQMPSWALSETFPLAVLCCLLSVEALLTLMLGTLCLSLTPSIQTRY